MRTLVWGKSFARAYKRTLKKRPEDARHIQDALRLLTTDPFAAQLETHKLKGILSGSWACSAKYDLRIVFDFVKEAGQVEDAILLIDIGTHEEVY